MTLTTTKYCILVELSNSKKYYIDLINSPLKNKIIKSLKHLQHVKLPYSVYDNTMSYSLKSSIEQLSFFANKLNINIDLDQINNQQYLNFLHSIYEKNYNGNRDWLNYHEAIHMIEYMLAKNVIRKITFDYREFAGLISTPFSIDELQNFTLKIEPGDCVVRFNELGKTPFSYWQDNEPNNLERFCALAKPWLRFNFAPILYFDKGEILQQSKIDQFSKWYSNYKKDWCKHWGISDWTIEQILGIIKVGHCSNWKELYEDLSNGSIPLHLKLINL